MIFSFFVCYDEHIFSGKHSHRSELNEVPRLPLLNAEKGYLLSMYCITVSHMAQTNGMIYILKMCICAVSIQMPKHRMSSIIWDALLCPNICMGLTNTTHDLAETCILLQQQLEASLGYLK